MKLHIVQDINLAMQVMYKVGTWMKNSGLGYSQWWDPKNMNRQFMLKHSETDEYFVALVDNKPAASVILQENERNQSWKYVDGNNQQKALYVHWLCVDRDFAGLGLSGRMINFAAKEAKKRGFKLLRLDTDADEPKLCKLYKNLGFSVRGIEKEDERRAIFFEMKI